MAVDQNMGHVRGAPYHPTTQGKIERRHQPLKNRVLLEYYFLPGANRCARDFASDYRSFRIETGGMKVPRLQARRRGVHNRVDRPRQLPKRWQ
jgi:hypothetical protein